MRFAQMLATKVTPLSLPEPNKKAYAIGKTNSERTKASIDSWRNLFKQKPVLTLIEIQEKLNLTAGGTARLAATMRFRMLLAEVEGVEWVRPKGWSGRKPKFWRWCEFSEASANEQMQSLRKNANQQNK